MSSSLDEAKFSNEKEYDFQFIQPRYRRASWEEVTDWIDDWLLDNGYAEIEDGELTPCNDEPIDIIELEGSLIQEPHLSDCCEGRAFKTTKAAMLRMVVYLEDEHGFEVDAPTGVSEYAWEVGR